MGTFKLYAFDIPSKGVVGRDLSDWDSTDLNECAPFVLSSASTLDNYADISSIEMWDAFGEQVLIDYQQRQKAIKLCFYEKGWDNCSSIEKDLVLKYYANPDLSTANTQSTQCIIYLMTQKGMSLGQAKDFLVDSWFNHWDIFIADCTPRFRRGAKIIASYLSFNDASNLDQILEGLKFGYLTSGILGYGYGDHRNGIMNFIHSDYGYDGNGMEELGYTLLKGSWENLKAELEAELVDDKFWPEIKPFLNE
jgi:hypothetical protein